MLVAAMVGLDVRSTMGLDATIKGADVNVEEVENLTDEIISVPIDDGVIFQVKNISEIMDKAEYPGICCSSLPVRRTVRERWMSSSGSGQTSCEICWTQIRMRARPGKRRRGS